jgi:AhpD family alkylhydroperoxidase
MQARIEMQKAAPGALQAMLALEGYVKKSSRLEASLLELVRMRASQINGCAYCLDMHSKDARAGGETEQRLYVLDAWRETPFFTDRERAALAWTEAVTLVSQSHVPDSGMAAAANPTRTIRDRRRSGQPGRVSCHAGRGVHHGCESHR